MADVQIQQTPGEGPSGGSASWVWAIVVIALLALLAWFLFARGGRSSRTDINVNTPGAQTGGGTGGGGTTPGKTP
jgi:hypothetical protein